MTSVSSNICVDLVRSNIPGRDLSIDNDGVLYRCLKNLKEFDHSQTRMNPVEYLLEMQKSANASFLSLLYLQTSLPLDEVDSLTSQLFEFYSSSPQPLPALILFGIRGNEGFVLDGIPVRFVTELNRRCPQLTRITLY